MKLRDLLITIVLFAGVTFLATSFYIDISTQYPGAPVPSELTGMRQGTLNMVSQMNSTAGTAQQSLANANANYIDPYTGGLTIMGSAIATFVNFVINVPILTINMIYGGVAIFKIDPVFATIVFTIMLIILVSELLSAVFRRDV
jgi:hypothetical protein